MKRKFGICHLKTPKWLYILRETLQCPTPKKNPSKRKFQEKKHLKTPKATSLSGSVSNSAEVRQKTLEDSISQVERIPEIVNADKADESTESIASLSLKLNKSREENVELESFIHKLEETIKRQNLDMEILSNLTAPMESPWLNNQMEIPPNLAACKESPLFNNLMEIPLNLAACKESSCNLIEIPQDLAAFKVSFNDNVNFIYMELIVSRYKTYNKMLREVTKLEKKLEIIEDSEHWKQFTDIKLWYERRFDDQEKEISSLKARLFGSVPKTCNAEAVCRNVGDADLLEQMEELKEEDHEHDMWEMNPESAAIEDESKKFLKESNASLSLQLKKSQEEKVHLDLVIQELKETIVKQKLYMEKPEVKQLLSIKLEKDFCRKNINSWYMKTKDLFAKMEKLKKKVNEIEDTEDAKNLEKKVSDIRMDYERKLSAQKEEISSLKAKLENVTC